MKLKKQQQEEVDEDECQIMEEEHIVKPTTNENESLHWKCPNCKTKMESTKDMAVQCEMIGNNNKAKLLVLSTDSKNGSRRGSVQSITEVHEDVAYGDNVVTTETSPAPDEILLVTRSFECEASPQPPRRSSISQFLSNITSVGNRHKSEPVKKRKFLGEQDACSEPALRSGIRRGSIGLEEVPEISEEKSNASESYPTNDTRMLHRQSIQLGDGTLMEEEIEECNAESTIATDENMLPGDINIITRSFENIPEKAPRKGSIFDKVNFMRAISDKFGNQENTADNQTNAMKIPGPMQNYPASGVRRKSLTPALYVSIEEHDEDGDYQQGACATEVNPSPEELYSFPDPVRYVTSGIRRGSVAAVSVAPPCRKPNEINTVSNQNDQMSRKLTPEVDETPQNVRYVTEGLRRGSVAMVSAAPPCIGATNGESSGNQRSGNELNVSETEGLRSGIRRRSLTPAENAPSKPSPACSQKEAKRRSVRRGASSDDSEGELEEKAGKEADEFITRVNKRIEKRVAAGEERGKGVVDLFEGLTGRAIAVDYATADARRIQEKIDAEEEEKLKQHPIDRASIPTIKLSFDDEIEENDEFQSNS